MAIRLLVTGITVCALLVQVQLSAELPESTGAEDQTSIVPSGPKPSPVPPLPPECGPTSGCRLSLAMRTQKGWEWATVTLTPDEQSSFAQAWQQTVKGQRFIGVRAGKTGLEFVVEDAKPAETQPLLKLERGEKPGSVERFRVVPKGGSYPMLKERADSDSQ